MSEVDLQSKSRQKDCDRDVTGADNEFNGRREENQTVNVSLALSPDGRYFATAADHCDISLWDTQTGLI